ncbi:MAG TPA: LacI family transcriptional regulator [Clostridiales bacterium]|nr:LacI family transcriptional regulator [Clostridiales bacterium]
MKKKNRISSKDVAREAGVSQATVSYVLNNVEHVKIRPETRQAVLDAVKKLNYCPSHIARGMKLNRSMSVGVITDRSVTNYNFMKTLEGIKDGLSRYNYTINLIFSKQEENFDAELMDYYNANRLDGFIFAFAMLEDRTHDVLRTNGVPYVIIDSYASGRGGHEVVTDHLSHLPELFALFKKKGAEKMAYVGPQVRHRADPRPLAFKEAVELYGQQDYGCHFCPFNDDQIRNMIQNLLRSPNRPEGIIAGTPRFGFHTLKTAAELGLKVPGDLLVASLGTSAFHGLCNPGMTAVELPLYDMGVTGADVLVGLMNEKHMEGIITLPSELVLRESL